MRIVFGLIGLVVVLAIVATLAKKQLGSVSEIKVPLVTGTASGTAPPTVDPNASLQQQSQQIQQQYKQAIEGALQQSRPMPDDK
jgi:H+/gluconate symporter-like permease